MFAATLPPINIHNDQQGSYCCAGCRAVLFEASRKFDAGCGFPSFWDHAGNSVRLVPLHTYGRTRVQLLCAACGRHLGHLFAHKHTPTKVRYCISEQSIYFKKV